MNEKYNILSSPLSLFISITNKCNLMCKHCFLDDKNSSKELNFEEWEKIIKEIVKDKIFAITITGGEPLLREDFFQIIDCFSSWQRLNLATNGILLNKLNYSEKIASRFNNILISIDGPRDIHDKIRGAGAFDETVKGLKKLSNYMSIENIKINYTISKINMNYLDQFINWALEIRIKNVSFGQAMKVGEDNGDLVLSLTEKLYIAKKIKWLQNKYSNKINIKTDYFDMFLKLFTNIINSDFSKKNSYKLLSCDAGYRSACVLENGVLVPCMLLGKGYSLETEDNLLHNTLKNVWNKSDSFNKWRNLGHITILDICQECILKYDCINGCCAENYIQTKKLFTINKLNCLL